MNDDTHELRGLDIAHGFTHTRGGSSSSSSDEIEIGYKAPLLLSKEVNEEY